VRPLGSVIPRLRWGTSIGKLIRLHRYLGTLLGVFLVIWFVSGIGMIFAGGMPELTPERRLERMPSIDFARVRLPPIEALAKAGLSARPERMILLTVMDRPAYRVLDGDWTTVFADTGEVLDEVTLPEILAIASRFVGVSSADVRDGGIVRRADQWTIALRGQLPLRRIIVRDERRTELYVSPSMGEVVLETTRSSRMLAWAAAIPHWLYLAPLRINDLAWRRAVLWLAGTTVFLTLAGLALGVTQFSPRRPFRLRDIGSYNPYVGWMRWHYLLGLIFGVFTLTWVFSGFLSMEPWDWASGEAAGEGVDGALRGGGLELSQYVMSRRDRWADLLAAQRPKEIELLRIEGNPYFLAREPRSSTLLHADTLEVARDSFSIESILSRVAGASPGVGVIQTSVLREPDSYYYSRLPTLPLPVLRIMFHDPAATWLYIDPALCRIVARYTRRQRIERWLYHGLHSLDFSFWYYNRPLWSAGVIALCLGGAASSGIGLCLGLRRVARRTRRVLTRRK